MLRTTLVAAAVPWLFVGVGCATLVTAENGKQGRRGGTKTISARVENGVVVVTCREGILGREATPYGVFDGVVGHAPCAAGTQLDLVAGDMRQTRDADERGEARFSLPAEAAFAVASTPQGIPLSVHLPAQDEDDEDVASDDDDDDDSAPRAPHTKSEAELHAEAVADIEAEARYAAAKAEREAERQKEAQAEADWLREQAAGMLGNAVDQRAAMTPTMKAAEGSCLKQALPSLRSDEPLVELRRPQRVPSMDRRTGEQTFPARMLAQGLIADRDDEGRPVFKLGFVELLASDGAARMVGFEPARPGYPDLAYPECGAADCRAVRLVLNGRTLDTLDRRMEFLREWTIEGVTVVLKKPVCTQTAQSGAGSKIVPLTAAGELLAAWEEQTRR